MSTVENKEMTVAEIEREIINALPSGAKLSDIVTALANVIKQIAEIWDVAHQEAIDLAKLAATTDQKRDF